VTIELFNLSYFIAFMTLTLAFRLHERKAYQVLKPLLERDSKEGSPVARLIELDNAHIEWMRRVGRLEVAAGLLACELLGLAVWGLWTGAKTLWGLA
jgi:hypothetical protein